jgi:chromosome partitioning protein
MEIIFANQKGGVGKTSLSILFANYLVTKGKKVIVIEMDIQQSITSTRNREIELGENLPPKPYEVIYTKLSDYPRIAEKLKSTDINIVIDLPGKMDDPHLVPVLKNGDLIVCPFDYDVRSFISTGTFASVIKKLDSAKDIVFIPNRIKVMNYELKEEVHNSLKKLGLVTDDVSDRAAVKRISTFGITDEQKGIVGKVFDLIIEKYKI